MRQVSGQRALGLGSIVLGCILLPLALLASFYVLAAFSSEDVNDWDPDGGAMLWAVVTLAWLAANIFAVATRQVQRRLRALAVCVALAGALVLLAWGTFGVAG